MPDMDVILASRSPRRLHLLQSAGLKVEVRAPGADESRLPDEDARSLVLRLATVKADTQRNAPSPVIAADTLVLIDEDIVGQPKDRGQAAQMLGRLAGREHRVITGVCVRYGEAHRTDVVSTSVRVRPLTEEEIKAYLDHNDYLDKAGAYAIQEGAASFVEETHGPMDNVIGLPVHRTMQLLAEVVRA